MDYQILFFIVLAAAVFLGIGFYFAHTERHKLLADYKPLKSKYDKLSEDFQRLKALTDGADSKQNAASKTEKKSAKKSAKKQESQDSPVVSELNDKIKELKADNAKLKERNYNLSKDNDELRKSARSNASSNEQDQHELLELRELRDTLNASLAESKSQISAMEKQMAELKDMPAPAKNAVEQTASDSDDRIASLERQNQSLDAALKDVRAELAAYKRDFKSQVDAAKNEVAEANRALRKDVQQAQRQMAQSKKRADNNHKIYLIARAQMLLAEQKLTQYEPGYQSVLSCPVTNDAIDEIVKKFLTLDARESRASVDVLQKNQTIDELNQRIKALESENASLKTSSQIAAEGRDDSITELVNHINLSELNCGETQSDNAKKDDIDFAKIDDDWDIL